MRVAALVLVAVVLPAGMVYANRSSALVLSFAALLAVFSAAMTHGLAPLGRQVFAAAKSPIGACLIALLGLSAFSLLHGLAPMDRASRWLGLVSTLIAGFGVAIALGRWSARRLGPFLVAGVILTLLLLITEIVTGLAVRRLFGARADAFALNRAAVTVLILSIALVPLWRGLRWRVVFAAYPLLLGAILSHSESGAAFFGWAIGLLALPLVILRPRFAIGALMVLIVIGVASAPWHGELAARLIPPAWHAGMAQSHSYERVMIWQSFGEAARAQPWFGAGFEASLRLALEPVAGQVSEANRTMLAASHPHNGFLQVWVELGAFGAILTATVLIMTLRRIGRLDPDRRSGALLLLVVALVIGGVSHGVWQAWWFASVGAAAVLIAIAAPEGGTDIMEQRVERET